MRGASALQDALQSIPSPRIRALVVWEKVLETDGKPDAATLALVPDRRAIQFWDADQLLSKAILKDFEADPALPADKRHDVVWDVIAVFAPGKRWDATFPRPDFEGHPVILAIAGAKDALTRLAH